MVFASNWPALAFMTSTLAEELEEKGLPESAQANRISAIINEVIDQTRGVARGYSRRNWRKRG